METKRELADLIKVNKELAAELFLTHKEIVFQNEDKEKRAVELIVENKNLSEEFDIAHKELAFQNEEKAKRAAELVVANKELSFQNEEKEKRAAELIIANKELAFQIEEKVKRAAELIITNKELAYQAELAVANKELALQYEEKAKRSDELILKNSELQQLLHLNADKDLFISILAHDLRNPFSALLNLSELLITNIAQQDIAEIENIGNQILKSAQSTYNLLEDILMWARAQSGQVPFKPRILSLSDICKDILEVFKTSADVKKITINCSTNEALNVFGDFDMLKAVFRNLVSNAIKFTNRNGQVDIYPEPDQENVTIIISDNGVGIQPDNLAKLFDVSQIHSTVGTAEEKGAGLGLILCKQFIEKHGGKIWVESEYGKGSEFKFTLPLSDARLNALNIITTL
jgi:signal transduction histidine kinase